ncbi:5-(carboxyamino)imidazole ribonucleotide synthase [Denitrobaculum tricleocarpae]|uniref:N5-carboxyaminoimidazole ribonucleotide synthase n=1 Tax=Denitrobaculum tricleocarpae TaxID=2591009 RepID=A0A545TWW4_9PROT|nr:5-(carboxyamino)imidazole ribonucleotide synthase [Denitrobaculum tricleocarpae]TQV81699.1 5-(carboxyamino)imidazole ribonucleotide synthase [Denitrobaculum tricleocarpae]
MSDSPNLPLPPGATIGMLGGGQLGRMVALSAAALGYKVHVFSPETYGPASQVTSLNTVADYDDWSALEDFAASVEVVTYEFENVPSETAEFLAKRCPVRPGPNVLHICQNRLREKEFCNSIDVPTTRYAPVQNAETLSQVIGEFGLPAILKTAEFGYDGKGQVFISPGDDIAAAWESMSGGKQTLAAVLEAVVDFRMEISVIIARGGDQSCECYVPVENRHKNHILDETHAPAGITSELAERAETIARRLADAMDLQGMLAIEMFVTSDDQILVNEMAPRPHNSGHWTMDACVTSQFEQFMRAVAGLPLGSPERHSNAVMKNLIGDDAADWKAILSDPGAKLHLYGKAEARPGRKMGHVNRLLPKA